MLVAIQIVNTFLIFLYYQPVHSAPVLQESQGLITCDFVMLLLVMISLHMLTFRLMVTMVADFCSLVILIHNTLLGEITISSTRTTRVDKNIIPLFPST